MGKAEVDALGKVFAHEIERAVGERRHNMPFQSKAAIFKRLAVQGLLEESSVMVGEPPIRVLVSGYELTHAGRFLYCSSCEGEAP
jgi:hypothetical protein